VENVTVGFGVAEEGRVGTAKTRNSSTLAGYKRLDNKRGDTDMREKL
jgi:hypothetical protein